MIREEDCGALPGGVGALFGEFVVNSLETVSLTQRQRSGQ
jgi:hypothetical protein